MLRFGRMMRNLTLDDLGDVNLPSANQYDLLVFGATEWQAQPFLERLGIGVAHPTVPVLHASKSTPTTNDIIEVARFQSTTSTAQDGFGVGISFYAEDSDGSVRQSGEISFFKDNANPAINSDFAISLQAVGYMLPIIKSIGWDIAFLDYSSAHYAIMDFVDCGAADRTLTINMNESNRSIDFSAAGSSLDIAGATIVSQDYSSSGAPTFGDLTLGAPVNIYGLNHNSFLNGAGNQHIDWTNTNANLDTSGSMTASVLNADIHISVGLGSPYVQINGAANTIGLSTDTDLMELSAGILDINGTVRCTRMLCGGVQT